MKGQKKHIKIKNTKKSNNSNDFEYLNLSNQE